MRYRYEQLPVLIAERLAAQYEEHGYALHCDGDTKLVWTVEEDEE